MSATVAVQVPATSANLGPGYDSFGLAFDIFDEVTAELLDHPVDPAFCVSITGEGAQTLPTDRSHLVHSTASTVLSDRGLSELADRLHLTCRNVIPQSRGLGSSASAIVAGIAIADALTVHAGHPEPTAAQKLAWATHFEGHPDNAAPALFGGVSVNFIDTHGHAQSASVPTHPDLQAVIVIPDVTLDTHTARGLLPATVSHRDAAANSAAAGLFVHAIANDPELLFEGTVDRLHQEYRRPAMPATLERIDVLRAAGLAAVVSGAGPSVLVLGRGGDLRERVTRVLGADDAVVRSVGISEAGVTTTAVVDTASGA